MSSGISSFVKVRIGNKQISLITEFSYTQLGDSSIPIQGISGEFARYLGYAQKQIGYILSFNLPMQFDTVINVNDIAIDDGSQITSTLNRASSNNSPVDYSGVTTIFSDLAPITQGVDLPSGAYASKKISFYALNMVEVAGA